MKCNLCPRSCNATREELSGNGFCKMPLMPKVALANLHFWEEPCISGENGSGTIFFSGCSLSCVYCQNYNISQEGYGKIISVERLAQIFKELEEKGANNINLVNPTHYTFAIKKALDIYKPNIPIVYNSSGYEKVEVLKSLEDYVDIYLLDLKYLSSDRANEYSNAPDYPEYAKNAVLEAYRQKGECVFKNGIMQKGLIIRHLILPQGTAEAISVFDFVHKNTPNAYFSIMSQYTPLGKAIDLPKINRKITKREYDKVLGVILNSNFQNVFMQELNSSSAEYVPNFNLYGV